MGSESVTMKNNDISFSKQELERYSRHLIMPEFTIEGQRKLKKSRVLVVGAGGLGAPLLQYLTAAGVGIIGIIDSDVVEESNLQRQVLFDSDDVGQPKVEAAKKKLTALNPHVRFETYNIRLTSQNALDILGNYDVVADGTDNFPTRYLVNDACVLLDKPNVYGSIFRFEGQVSVFNYTWPSGEKGPDYRDLFPEPPPPGLVPSCAEGGVLGVLPGIVGSLQANEALKVITGIGEVLAGRLFLFDALNFETRTIRIFRDAKRPRVDKLIDYQAFCGTGAKEEAGNPREITVHEFNRLVASGEPYQLIDVREPHEFAIANLGGELIPLGKLEEQYEKIASDRKVIVHCKGGARSAKAIRKLQEKFGFQNLYNLKGGILAYSEEIDGSLASY